MLSLLSAALLVAVTLTVPATVLVFTVPVGRRRRRLPTSTLAVTGAAVVVAVAALGAGAVLGIGPLRALPVSLLLGASVAAWGPAGREWDLRGLVAWSLSIDAGLLYLGYVVVWTLEAGLGLAGTAASAVLWLLESFVFLVGVSYLWEFVDVLSRRTWTGDVDPERLPGRLTGHRPFVSLHVPTHHEPPHLVIETLETLLRLDYDAYEVLVVDNNTTDPALWRPVEAFCARHERLVFIHLEDWPGFKSGALNHALTRTDPRAEVIGIVDADYLVDPDFLSRCAPLFGDESVAFVQTPQDYRGWEDAPYFRRLYYSYGYFFDVSQRSRNERNGAIFGGTMGLIRRSALAEVGGWDEWCITEDAELSLRLLRAGDRGVHVDRSFGRGVMPLTFEALKRQRFRWCFGGVQILRLHWRSLLPGPRTEANRLTLAQRWAYLVGGLQWFGDLASVLFTGFLVAGALTAVGGDAVIIRRLSTLLVVCLAVLLVLGAGRSLALVRRTSGATWREACGAFGLWVALGWTVARASARALVAREGVFLRTPKVRGELGPGDTFRGNGAEIVLALGCSLVAVVALARSTLGTTLVGVLLLVQASGYAAAPFNSLAAIRSDLPDDLERRRRELKPSWGRPVRRGGLVVAGWALALGAFVVFAGPVGGPGLGDLPGQVLQQAQQTQGPATSAGGEGGPAAGEPSRSVGSTGPAGPAPSHGGTTTAAQAPTSRPAAPTPTQAQSPTTRPAATRPTQVPTTHPTHSRPTQAPTTHPTRRNSPPPSPTRKPTTTQAAVPVL